MNLSPLVHGSAGPLDEIILAAEGLLVLALVIMFFRSRKHKPLPPNDKPDESGSHTSSTASQ